MFLLCDHSGAALGTEVTTAVATDTDVNHYLNYYFREGGNPGNVFAIDAYSGKITVAKELDYEEENRYQLVVQVRHANFMKLVEQL